MRFEVSYSSGVAHEVDLPGSLVVLGRDPGCDIVLNDTKCSRRHAVVETTPEGLVIRDSGSANGVYVNGRRVDRSFVKAGDTIRLGDVSLRMLAEVGETVIVALDDIPLPGASPSASLTQERLAVASGAPPAPPAAEAELAPPREPRHRPEAPSSRPEAPHGPPRPTVRRPLTVTVLSFLWALGGPSLCAVLAVVAWRLRAGALEWGVWAMLSLLLLAGAFAMSIGLHALAPWARHLQIAGAYLSLLACPFTPAAATTLLYLNRADVKRVFQQGAGGAGTAEPTFALSILAMVLLGLLVSIFAAFVAWPAH